MASSAGGSSTRDGDRRTKVVLQGAAPDGRAADRPRQGRPCGGPPVEPRRLPALGGPSDPLALLEEQAADRVPELVPIRYGRMLVSPFTFYRGAASHHGRRSGLDPYVRASRAGVRRRPPLELRRLRLARTSAHVRPERLRRDASRAVGVGPEAAGGKSGHRRAQQWVHGRRAADGGAGRRASVPHVDGGVRVDAEPPGLVLASRHRGRAADGSVANRKRTKALEKDLAKARARDNVQAFTKLTDEENGEPRILSDPPLIVPIEELLPEGVSRAEVTEILLQMVRRYRGTLETDRRHLLEQFRFVHLARKVVGVGSVGPGVDRLVPRAGQQRPLVPPDQGGTGVGPRALHVVRAPTPTTGSGWWRASV